MTSLCIINECVLVIIIALQAVLCAALIGVTKAQPSTCNQIGKTQCPTEPPYHDTAITINGTFRYVKTSMCPPYKNPSWTNPSQACMFEMTYRIPVTPRASKVPIPVGEKQEVFEGITYLKEDPKPILGVLGVLKNGVNVFGVGSPCGYSSKCPEQGGPTKWVDAVESEGHTVDFCGGHAAPTHQYHIHSGVGLNSSTDRANCELPQDKPGEHSELLGWLLDGYGLYGRLSTGGKLPTDLDDCHGHTHEINGVNIYHYHMPDKFPWTIGCFKGCPEVSNNPRELGFVKTNSTYGC